MDYDDRFLASPKDAEKLAESVVWIHQHPEETAQVVTQKQQKVRERYDKVTLYETFGRLYTAIVEGKPWRA